MEKLDEKTTEELGQKTTPKEKTIVNQGRGSSDTPVSRSYQCPECEYSSPSFSSVRGHAQKKHRIKLILVNGVVEVVEKSKKDTTPPPSVSEEPIISTEADQLKDILKSVKFDKIGACLKLCDSYGFDVIAVYRALKELGAGRHIIKPTISYWSAYYNEPIPRRIAEELGLIIPQRPHRQNWRETYHVGGSPYDEEEGKSKIGPLSDLSIAEYFEAKREKIQNPPSNNSNPQLNAVLAELSESRKDREKLRDEIRTLKENETRQIITDLREDVRSLRSETGRLSNQYSVIEKGLGTFEHLGGKYFQILAQREGLLIGGETPPKREKIEGGKSTIVSMLPPELIEEE